MGARWTARGGGDSENLRNLRAPTSCCFPQCGSVGRLDAHAEEACGGEWWKAQHRTARCVGRTGGRFWSDDCRGGLDASTQRAKRQLWWQLSMSRGVEVCGAEDTGTLERPQRQSKCGYDYLWHVLCLACRGGSARRMGPCATESVSMVLWCEPEGVSTLWTGPTCGVATCNQLSVISYQLIQIPT